MEIIKLIPGQIAPVDSDCIRIQETDSGKFELEGAALVSCGDVEASESISIVGGEPYGSYDDAEAAGLAWASEYCPETLYVSRSDGSKPLPYSA